MRLLVAVTLAILPCLAFSAISQSQCSEVDLSSNFGPIRDQGHAGFCYSFAAADALAEAVGIRPPETVSAMYLAAQYVSMTPSETSTAINDIQFGNSVLPGTPSAGYGSPLISYNPSGKPLLKREGGFPDLILSRALELPKVCTESDVPSEGVERARHIDRDQFFMVRMAELAGGDDINAYIAARKNKAPLPNCLNKTPLAKMVGLSRS